MGEYVPFRLHLTGETADRHQFQGYDGYMALAGFAWTLSLVTNFVETGIVRHRGDFPGRHAVRARAPAEGSVIADFIVWVAENPVDVLGLAGAGVSAIKPALFLQDVVKRVIDRNLGQTSDQSEAFERLFGKHYSQVEKLVAATEPSIRQAHSVIGNGASQVRILGGANIINTFNEETRDYVKLNVEDRQEHVRDFMVTAFSVNSGWGTVYDSDLGRNIPIAMSRDTLRDTGSVFTWALNEYANKTSKRISVRYWRILAMDGTPKRYMILDARR